MNAIDADAEDRIGERLPDLSLDLASELPPFLLPENVQGVPLEENVVDVLLHRPLLPAQQAPAHVPADAVAGTFLLHLADELTAKPGRGFDGGSSFDR